MAISQDQFDRIAREMPGFGRDPASIRRRIEAMEAVLEGLFVIPGTKYRVGLDSLVGLVPVVGDLATAAMGAWIVWEARNLGMSKWQITRMAANVGVDTVIGAIPFAGDLFDFLYKSNTKNLRIIRKHLDRHHPATVTIDA
ncbi:MULTISPECIES: DUF4112 domain-containing protein [Sphingobium]|jgi:hypothetical protein|uniref:DUF4112 domain-containing protein n=1 Tax=Sphingobium limneticum TaxID=1007511 RepID=A0A5J5I353_9SPHN|nr:MULTISPECIES: DUF4112 domain-containing protein [Sphingobium]MBU0933496.1 DUF4112 domain-containing protein [Alphaproteobacteria bacterium]KAA9016167.1 DUF4112 domain-containing protein [Sphingobium limneticum]KAA9017564.1 DUF4112 domain-containing protein [Sphingobium limneticum]KAA9030154.1 DUF4112 domain-containing protein [Sphingobium limneticum]BBD00682.1 hypothetical protein YGS_C1P1937 [Sphingobium sp. YG1]